VLACVYALRESWRTKVSELHHKWVIEERRRVLRVPARLSFKVLSSTRRTRKRSELL